MVDVPVQFHAFDAPPTNTNDGIVDSGHMDLTKIQYIELWWRVRQLIKEGSVLGLAFHDDKLARKG